MATHQPNPLGPQVEPRISVDQHGLVRVGNPLVKPRNPRSLANLNRSGRGKGTRQRVHAEIAHFARQYGPECIANLVHLMRTHGDDPDVVIRCADILLTRGYGRPPTAVAISGPDGGPIDFRSLDDDRLDQFIERLEAATAIEGEVVGMGEGGEGTP